jgi:cell division protein FtsB
MNAPHELDLIPADYRRTLQLRRSLRYAVVGYLCLVAAIGAGRWTLTEFQRRIDQQIATLQADKAFNSDQQQKLTDLADRRRRLERELDVLEGLRGGIAARSMFHVIDRSVNEETWFRSWSFKREGERTDASGDTVHAGYLIILSEEPGADDEQAWRLTTHMEIEGSALDHSALSMLVEHLLRQPEISDVRVLRAQRQRAASGEVVNFQLAVTVQTRSA